MPYNSKEKQAARNKRYYEAHKEELNRKRMERYYEKKSKQFEQPQAFQVEIEG